MHSIELHVCVLCRCLYLVNRRGRCHLPQSTDTVDGEHRDTPIAWDWEFGDREGGCSREVEIN